jgi:hypothetical protein
VEQKQISEAALHPDGEFTVGPLTFRIEYEYLGDVTPPEEVGVAAEGTGEPEGELGDPTDFALGEPAPADVDETFPVEVQRASEAPQPAIAPADGGLPDFSAWEAADAEPDEEAQAAGRPASPGTAESAPAAPQPEQEEAHLAETLELAPSQTPRGARVEVAAAEGPDQTTDGPDQDLEEPPQPEPPAAEPPGAPEADEPLAVDLEESAEKQASDEVPDSTGAAEFESGTSAEQRLSDDEELNKFLKGFD